MRRLLVLALLLLAWSAAAVTVDIPSGGSGGTGASGGDTLPFTVETTSPVTGTTPCLAQGHGWLNTALTPAHLFYCTDVTAKTWVEVPLPPMQVDSSAVVSGTTPCDVVGQMHKQTGVLADDIAICTDAAADTWQLISSRPVNVTSGTISDPVTITSAYDRYVSHTTGAITVTRFQCIEIGGTSVTLGLFDCPLTGAGVPPDTATNCISISSITCDGDGAQSSALTTAVAASRLFFVDVGAPTGAITSLTYSIKWRSP